MIAIITEKPSVGMDIARVVGAHDRHNGYMEGHGYIVTWALGHLVQLALPEAYGRKRGTELPFIPDPFQYTIRQTFNKAGKNLTDVAALRQLHIIRRALAQCESVINGWDAGREGERIFRLIYDHTGCTLPVRRLWISSLTEEAIEKGFDNLREGAEYDRLHQAADCRAKADWLVGMNASNALSRVSGRPDSSLGRVQTPTLAMIASRYLEHRGFLPSDYWSLSATLGNGDTLRKLPPSQEAFPAASGDGRRSVGEARTFGALRKFRYVEDIRDKVTAEAISARLKSCTGATVIKVERKTVHEAPPLLYDLTALQRSASRFVSNHR